MHTESQICLLCSHNPCVCGAQVVSRASGGFRQRLDPVAPYRPHENVRTTDPETSHAAAATVSVTEVQRHVIEIHRDHPKGLTDEELLRHYQQRYGAIPESSPRKRRCDVTKLGIIIDSDERRPLKTGRTGIVWVLDPTRSATVE